MLPDKQGLDGASARSKSSGSIETPELETKKTEKKLAIFIFTRNNHI